MFHLLARDEYIWFLHSFLLEIFRCTLLTLGNYHPLLHIYKAHVDFERTARQSTWKESVANGQVKHTYITLLVRLPQLDKIVLSKNVTGKLS